ncbi:MAG TPA: choice-of-anchor D domain-containing protein, partial [Candidatus Kapabacteria bacterium]|nr:choice-of-anchor D domain-containing protein [Candidatus Kapabacteria bacterium]
MLPPVSSWGKTYATIQLQRPPFKGDLFRIVAAENMTNYEVRWYDENTSQLIERRTGTLRRSGDFVEISEVMGAPGPNVQSIRGASIFSANKPILVLHYAYSASWDGNNNYDPFMIVTTAVEQFTNLTIFQTPSGQFNDNWFNIIAIGDTLDPFRHTQLIESIKLDGKPIYQTVPQFKMNQIPETNLFYARVRVGPGAHYVTGETPFGGYVYGFTSVDSYGWPAAMQFKVTDVVDTLPPQVYVEGSCGRYDVRFTELRNGKEGDDPLQQDLGVSDQPTLLENSVNFKDPIFPTPFTPFPPKTDFSFLLEVEDLTKDAVAYLSISDRAGNESITKIEYFADNIASNPNILQFGAVQVGTSSDLTYIIQNKGGNDVAIKSIKLWRGQYYQLVDLPEIPTIIPKKSESPINVRYSPVNESPNQFNLDIDSVLIETECLSFSFPLTGRGVIPKIDVTDYNFGPVVVGDKKCHTSGIVIRNTGSMDLVIDGFNWNPGNLAFTREDPLEPEFPVTITPGQSVLFRTVCFTPTDNGDYVARIDFNSNAASGKYWSDIRGIGIKPGPQITSFDWGALRVIDANVNMIDAYQGYVEVYNTGTSPLKFIRAEIDNDDNDGSYEVVGYEPNFIAAGQTQIEIWPETETDPNKTKRVRVNLRFKPITDNVATNVRIYPIFAASDK